MTEPNPLPHDPNSDEYLREALTPIANDLQTYDVDDVVTFIYGNLNRGHMVIVDAERLQQMHTKLRHAGFVFQSGAGLDNMERAVDALIADHAKLRSDWASFAGTPIPASDG